MAEKPTFIELSNRIKRDIEHFNGNIPERTAIAWFGYLAALIEWGLIEIHEHDDLCALLPNIEDDPARQILLGRINQ